MGKIEDGSTTSDFDDEEVRRTISLYTSVIPVEYRDTKINILDTPGYTDFVGEVISAMRVISCAGPIQVGWFVFFRRSMGFSAKSKTI